MSDQAQTSRRLFLAAGSASAVFGALAQATAAAPADADPIFAAIERHKAAEARYDAACGLTDEVAARCEGRAITPADHREFDAASESADDALRGFIETTPATLAGVRGFLRHCIDEESLKDYSIYEALETLLHSPVLADCGGRS
jgi:hypothetical protein